MCPVHLCTMQLCNKGIVVRQVFMYYNICPITASPPSSSSSLLSLSCVIIRWFLSHSAKSAFPSVRLSPFPLCRLQRFPSSLSVLLFLSLSLPPLVPRPFSQQVRPFSLHTCHFISLQFPLTLRFQGSEDDMKQFNVGKYLKIDMPFVDIFWSRTETAGRTMQYSL